MKYLSSTPRFPFYKIPVSESLLPAEKLSKRLRKLPNHQNSVIDKWYVFQSKYLMGFCHNRGDDYDEMNHRFWFWNK